MFFGIVLIRPYWLEVAAETELIIGPEMNNYDFNTIYLG